MLLPPIPPYTKQQLPTQRVTIPLVFPVLGATRWRASYNQDWGSHRHTGCDIVAPKLTPIVAPLSGTLGFKLQTFWIVGDDGWGCLGTHLNDDTPGSNDGKADPDYMFAPNLAPGERVRAGQLIGYVGDSGDANGPHLHLELHSPEGLRDPAPSLRSAQRLLCPLALLTASSLPGLTRVDGCPRGYDVLRRELRVLVVGEELPRRQICMAARPQFRFLRLGEAALQQLGGSGVAANLPTHRSLSFYLRADTVEKVVVPPPPPTFAPPFLSKPLATLGRSRLTIDARLERCAAAELAHYSQLSAPHWIRTGSMALGPLRMRGVQLKQAAILGLTVTSDALLAQPVLQEALRYSGFTRFGAAVGAGRVVVVLTDG